MAEELTGGCLCGRVRYTIRRSVLFQPYACHCKDCQTRSGSAFAIQLPVMTGDLRMEGETVEGRYTLPSGITAGIVACPDCLTRLYAVNDQRPQIVNLRAGTLDDSGTLVPAFHLWTVSKQSWVVIPDDVPALEAQPADLTEWQRLLLPERAPEPEGR